MQAVLLIIILGMCILYAVRPASAAAATEGFKDLAGLPTDPVDPTYYDAGPFAQNDMTNEDDAEDNTDDPRDLPWIASWSAADRAARTGQICAVLYEEIGPHGTIIQTVGKTCEEGMAHTRPGSAHEGGERVVLPTSVPQGLRAETLKHEMFHIYQRRNPEAWREFYHRSWRFEFHDAPPASMPASVLGARRSNPDTWDPQTGGPWAAWMGRYWPVAVYRDPQRPRLRDSRTVWWDATLQKLLLAPPSEWVTFFGRPAQEEHPHEIAAVLLTAEDTSTEAGRRINSWWLLNGPFLTATGGNND